MSFFSNLISKSGFTGQSNPNNGGLMNYLTTGWSNPVAEAAKGGMTITGAPIKKPITPALPTVAQGNASFMKNNPQYSSPSLFQKVTDLTSQTGSNGSTNTDSTGATTESTAGSTNTGNTGGSTSGSTGSTYVPPVATPPQSLWQSTVGKQANTTVTPETSTAVSGLQDIAQNQTPAVTEAQNQYNQFAKASPFLLSDVRNNPNVAAEVSVGRGQALGQTLSAEQQALQGNVQNALAGQGQQITAGNEAGGLANTAQQNVLTGQSNATSATQPQLGQYGQTYYNPSDLGQGGGTIKLTGQPSNDVSSLTQSVLNNNIDYNTAYSQLSGAYGGAVANQLLNSIKTQNPNFNPTQQSATTQAVAGQNAGITADYSKRATDLSANVQTVSAQAPLLISAIKSADLGTSGNQTLNQIMSSGLQQTNPGAYNAIQGYTQEINTAVQQMIGRGGINPTQVGLQAGNLDISNLPVSQLQSVLDNLQITGQATQGVYQKIAFEAGGGGATNAYMGGNVKTPTASTPVTPQPILPSDKSSYANAGIGAATTLFGDIGSVAKAAAGPVLDFLGLSSFF